MGEWDGCLLVYPEKFFPDEFVQKLRELKTNGRCRIEPVRGQRGAWLDPAVALEFATTANCNKVLLVGLRCREAVIALRRRGLGVKVIENRLYPGDVRPTSDKLPCYSAVEQVARLFNLSLDETTARTEVWRRDGWAGLSALGVAWKDAKNFPEKFYDPEVWSEAKAKTLARPDGYPPTRELDDLILLTAPSSLRDAVLDAAQEKDWKPDDRPGTGYSDTSYLFEPGNYEDARCRRQPVEVKPVLALFAGDGENAAFLQIDKVRRIEYRGPLRHAPWLVSLLADQVLTQYFDLCVERGQFRCRFLAERLPAAADGAVDTLVSRLLSVVLVTGRPLRQYTCTFYLLLDLHLDGELGRPPKTFAPAGQLNDCATRQAIERHPVAGPDEAANKLRVAFGQGGNGVWEKKLYEGERGEEYHEAQALLYFSPPAQRFVYDTGDKSGGEESKISDCSEAAIKPVAHWRLPPNAIANMELGLEKLTAAEEQLVPLALRRAAVCEVSLFGYYNNLYVLAIRVELPKAARKTGKLFAYQGSSWWHPLFWSTPAEFEVIRGLQMEAWLQFTKAARLLRPAFPEQRIENKMPDAAIFSSGECIPLGDGMGVSPVARNLLGRFFGDDFDLKDRLGFVRDDRMVVNVAYGLAGPEPAEPAACEAFERLFSLAQFVDRGTDGFNSQSGFAYDREFVRRKMEASVYRRWGGIGTLLGYSIYSNVAVGYGDTFNGPVARVHFPYIYGRMLLLALFYELTLAHFSRRIAAATRQLVASNNRRGSEQAGEFQELHRDFICFTNRYWVREVTTQMQGVEIFDLQTRALCLDEKYALVKDKLERADEYIEVKRGQSLDVLAVKAAIGGLVLALVAITVGFFQIDPVQPDPSFGQLLTEWRSLLVGEKWLAIKVRFGLAAVIAVAAVVFGSYTVCRLVRRIRSRKTRSGEA